MMKAARTTPVTVLLALLGLASATSMCSVKESGLPCKTAKCCKNKPDSMNCVFVHDDELCKPRGCTYTAGGEVCGAKKCCNKMPLMNYCSYINDVCTPPGCDEVCTSLNDCYDNPFACGGCGFCGVYYGSGMGPAEALPDAAGPDSVVVDTAEESWGSIGAGCDAACMALSDCYTFPITCGGCGFCGVYYGSGGGPGESTSDVVGVDMGGVPQTAGESWAPTGIAGCDPGCSSLADCFDLPTACGGCGFCGVYYGSGEGPQDTCALDFDACKDSDSCRWRKGRCRNA